MWACTRPLNAPQGPRPKPWCGLCGPPSLSEWAGGVPLFGGGGVLWGMVDRPVEGRSLERERSRHEQRRLERRHRLERAVGQHAVVADRDAEAADQVEPEEEDEVGPADRLVPEQRHRGDQSRERQDRDDEHREFAGAAGLRHRGVVLHQEPPPFTTRLPGTTSWLPSSQCTSPLL